MKQDLFHFELNKESHQVGLQVQIKQHQEIQANCVDIVVSLP